AIVVPLALLSVVTGLIVSVGTHWGLLLHWWVVTKFALDLELVATMIGFAVALWTATALSTYKPWGKTKRGRRKAKQRAEAARGARRQGSLHLPTPPQDLPQRP